MLTEIVGVDASRMASCSISAIECFNAFGGWNTLGPAMIVGAVLTAVYIKYGAVAKYYAKKAFASLSFPRLRERNRMNRAEQKRLQELASDLITDAFERTHFNDPGELSYEDKQALFRLIGKRCGFKDLLTRGEDTDVKEDIKARLAAEPRDTAGKVIPVKLPDKEVVTKTKTKSVTVF